MELSARMSRLGTETAFEVLARAKALEAGGRSIIHLEIGEPDFETPTNIIDAAKQALDDGFTHYGPSAGLPEFREIIAANDRRVRGSECRADEVVVTPGAKPIMFFAILALINKGDEVIYPNPGFPIYESLINFVNARPMPLMLREEHDFGFDMDEVERLVSSRTKLFIISSPQNPTGGVVPRSQLERIAELAVENDFFILTDEVYREILYEGEHFSIAQVPGMRERTVILDGFSKTYAMTGWRLGYGIMPAWLATQVAKLQTNSNSCTASFIQRAGMEALTGSQDPVVVMREEFRRRRDLIVAGLNAIEGISCLNPRGAFYVFPNIKELPLNSSELETYLLSEAGVATLSGTSFGSFGQGYLRLSYANSIDNIKEALSRIQDAVARL
ncbi:MAG: pyridoxal phosphate-dependent aminotransferase [Candidatus Delongbacteria bacterium]|nr:pyridoxal phosphate-dependent aminotransferase [Candidatus Delongbacteria bacterium]